MFRSKSAPSRLEHDVHRRRAVRECRCIGEYQYRVMNALYPKRGEPPPPIPFPLPDRLPPPPLRPCSPSPEAEPDLHPRQDVEVFVSRTPTSEPFLPEPPLPEGIPPRPTRRTPGAPHAFTPDPPIAPFVPWDLNPWDQALLQPQGAHGALPTPGAPAFTPDPPIFQPQGSRAHGALRRGAQ